MTEKEKVQVATAAANYLHLITAAAISNIHLGEHELNGADEGTIKDLASTTEKISQIAIKQFGLDQAEADRLKNQALAMAGLEGRPALMVSM